MKINWINKVTFVLIGLLVCLNIGATYYLYKYHAIFSTLSRENSHKEFLINSLSGTIRFSIKNIGRKFFVDLPTQQ